MTHRPGSLWTAGAGLVRAPRVASHVRSDRSEVAKCLVSVVWLHSKGVHDVDTLLGRVYLSLTW
jgi:hypothetical protein